eukprot:scaffold270_cov390-Prasinococcus_capsulatus_cf.AAC.19
MLLLQGLSLRQYDLLVLTAIQITHRSPCTITDSVSNPAAVQLSTYIEEIWRVRVHKSRIVQQEYFLRRGRYKDCTSSTNTQLTQIRWGPTRYCRPENVVPPGALASSGPS